MNTNSIQLKTIHTLDDMLLCFELIKLLNPKMTKDEYKTLLAEMIPNNYKQAIALIENKVVGVCGYWINTKLYSGKYIELDNVVVDEKQRGKKIGEQLCQYVIEIALEQNCNTAMLDAYIENEAAHSFYERLGYKKKGYHFIKKLC